MLVYQFVEQGPDPWPGVQYFLISLSLNILLTLMVVIRLILHARNTRSALGIAGISGLRKATITMLVESCALYTVSLLLVIGPWATGSYTASIFFLILSQTQVCAFLRSLSSGR